jgi:hypothetical protein
MIKMKVSLKLEKDMSFWYPNTHNYGLKSTWNLLLEYYQSIGQHKSF